MNPDIGYGILWYIVSAKEGRATSFFHTGAGVHLLGIYPAINLVIVHRVDTEHEYDFSGGSLYNIISLIFSAKVK